jgi:hypothetical protein
MSYFCCRPVTSDISPLSGFATSLQHFAINNPGILAEASNRGSFYFQGLLPGNVCIARLDFKYFYYYYSFRSSRLWCEPSYGYILRLILLWIKIFKICIGDIEMKLRLTVMIYSNLKTAKFFDPYKNHSYADVKLLISASRFF